ncbi:hypothetical protein TI04_13200 [Achromatium sp. WMS2]|nr:hypothetical protein TI04_13200 [Achromatium sp. WMS2]
MVTHPLMVGPHPRPFSIDGEEGRGVSTIHGFWIPAIPAGMTDGGCRINESSLQHEAFGSIEDD